MVGFERSLGDAIERGRENNFDLLRLVAALAVLFGHSFVLAAGNMTLDTIDPLSRFLMQYAGFNEAVHELAVDVFFVFSGFLVTRSFLTQPTLVGFIEARLLRIFPAPILCSVLTVAALAWFATLPLAAYLRDGQTWRFLIHNAMLWRIEYDLPGVFADNAYGGAVNGSLWTLPVELRAYLYLTVLGVPGLLRLRHGSSLVLAVWASLVTLTLATFSWFLVEQRALRRKGSMARVLARYRR